MSYKITYASMYDPPAELHTRYDAAMAAIQARLGGRHRLYIDGKDCDGVRLFEKRSPIDQRVLGQFDAASAEQVDLAVAAAKRAFPSWRAMPVAERLALLRRAGRLIEERVFEIAAALTLEVGKNRMEALAEAQETADFFEVYCDDFERHHGYEEPLPNDPLNGFTSRNRSVMRPHGVWGVIAPFNFPLALAAGPVSAALVTGNTVVLKAATDTPWSGRLLAEALHDVGLPPGVFNLVTGGGAEAGNALAQHRDLGGITFTGSFDIGMQISRRFAGGVYPRPAILEMGGKNPVIVTRNADLDRAALGIVRSAYGLGGQKCSAASRIYVDEAVADALIDKLAERISALRIGDPTRQENWLGPVIHQRAYRDFQGYCEELVEGGARMIAGGTVLAEDGLANGWFVAPTLAETPLGHRLWRHEMFLPIATLARVRDRDQAMALANDSPLGLTAGVYGNDDDVAWFQENIEAGVTYANRPQGATTGAWPGYQPFGGWKGSGSTGKAIASFYYLPLYLREQSRTVVD